MLMSDLEELRHPPPADVSIPMLGSQVEETCPPFRDADSPFEEGAQFLELLSEDVRPQPGLWTIPAHWVSPDSWVKRFLRKLAGGD
jgi:hypothetical protein